MGIPLIPPERNYRDDNHKPELEVALSDFWLLYGFRPEDQLQAVLNQVPEFHTFKPIFASGGYFELYKYVMEMPRVGECSSKQPGRARSSEIYFWRARRMFS